jgi:hypothetical protein
VEGGGDRLETKRGERDVDRLDGPAEALDRRPEEAVVGADENPFPGRHAHGERPARRPYAGVDDREVYAGRRIWERRGEDERAPADVVASDPVGDVDHRHVGRDPGDHGAADAGELVVVAVVAEERDGQRHG